MTVVNGEPIQFNLVNHNHHYKHHELPDTNKGWDTALPPPLYSSDGGVMIPAGSVLNLNVNVPFALLCSS